MENKSSYSEYVIGGVSATNGRLILVYASSKSDLSSLTKDASKARRFRYPHHCKAHLEFLNKQKPLKVNSDVVFHIYERKVQAIDVDFIESDSNKIKGLMEEIETKDSTIKSLNSIIEQLHAQIERLKNNNFVAPNVEHLYRHNLGPICYSKE
jgi:SMC interacting uncharacterized protein involved in chromosome segregation